MKNTVNNHKRDELQGLRAHFFFDWFIACVCLRSLIGRIGCETVLWQVTFRIRCSAFVLFVDEVPCRTPCPYLLQFATRCSHHSEDNDLCVPRPAHRRHVRNSSKALWILPASHVACHSGIAQCAHTATSLLRHFFFHGSSSTILAKMMTDFSVADCFFFSTYKKSFFFSIFP